MEIELWNASPSLFPSIKSFTSNTQLHHNSLSYMSVAAFSPPCRRVCHGVRVSTVHAAQHAHIGDTANVWFSLERVRRHSHSNAIATDGPALKRATLRLHVNATVHASGAKSSWGKFGRKPTDYSHLSPRLRAALEKKNEEKLAFQHIELPVEVYPEPPQTVTTDEELQELAPLQPSRAQLEEWRDIALQNGRYEEANDLLRLLSRRRAAWPYHLLDPSTPSHDLDWQLVDMLARGRENARLAADDNLRPYDDPLDGAAMNAWLLERIKLRLANYRAAEQRLTMVIAITLRAVLNIANRSARSRVPFDRLLQSKRNVMALMLQVEYMLHVSKRIIQNNYALVGRNLLLADEHKDRMQGWKQNINRVTSGWLNLSDILDRLPGERVARFINFPELSALFTAMVANTRQIKYAMKGLRILHSGYDTPAIADANACRQVTHRKYQTQAGITNMAMDLRKWYLSQCRQGWNYTDSAVWMMRFEDYVADVIIDGLQKVERCLFFIKVSRISREHNYQKWSVSAPRPVLPDYIKKAVETHREQSAAQSIY